MLNIKPIIVSDNRQELRAELLAEGRKSYANRGKLARIVCHGCGIRIIVSLSDSAGLFCSSRCHMEWRNETPGVRKIRSAGSKPLPREQRICVKCDGTFLALPHSAQKFCSVDCRFGEGWGRRVSKPCEHCGKTMHGTEYKLSRRRYCSRECWNEANPKTPTEFDCRWCGTRFTKYYSPAEIRQGNGQYCSLDCTHQALAKAARKSSGTTTNIERALYTALDTLGIDYVEEKRFGRFFVDAYLPEYNLAIEADGEYWHSFPEAIEREQRKGEYLRRSGVDVVRIWGKVLLSDAEGAVKAALDGRIVNKGVQGNLFDSA